MRRGSAWLGLVLPVLPTPTWGRGLRPGSPLAGPAEIRLPEGQPFPRPDRWLAVLLKAAEKEGSPLVPLSCLTWDALQAVT